MKETENKIVLYTNEISCYDELKKEYLEHCHINEIEPEENGEYAYHSFMCDQMWMDFMSDTLPELEKQAEKFLMVGTSGTWQGRRAGGLVSTYLKTIISKFTEKLDNVTITYDSADGSIELSGSHHDGSNYYTVYALNKRAERAIDAAESAHDTIQSRYFHEKLDQKYYKRQLMLA